jgi:hypothetical protein
MTGIINNTNFKSFDEVGRKNSSKIYLRKVEKKGVALYKVAETNWPILKKMEHFFKQIFSGHASTHYWHGKEKVVKHCEKII